MNEHVRPPNMRVQRTRSSASPPHSPLTRGPLGGRKSLLGTVATLFLTVAGSGVADGKCGYIVYQLNAEVRDSKSQEAIVGAALVFFADDEAEMWPLDWSDTKQENFRSGQDGKFSGVFRLSSQSGSFITDRCNRKLKRVTVVVTRDGYVGRLFHLSVSKLGYFTDDGRTVINLPPLDLSRAR